MSPYHQALAVINDIPGTSGATGLAKLVLSLYNDVYSFGFSECTSSLDAGNRQIALAMVAHYAAHGEGQDLREVGRELVDRFPRLRELALAMRDARNVLRDKWEREHEQQMRRDHPEEFE